MSKKNLNKVAKLNVEVDMDALINESKNIDMEKVDEVLTEAKIVEEKEKELKAQEEEKAKEIETINETLNFVDVTEVNSELVEKNDVEAIDSEVSTDENIDDVIAECTGETDGVEQITTDAESKDTEKEKKEIPWYVARAMRGNDYFSW